MRFTKMHGAGNDYVYLDAFHETLPDDLADLARRISDRHRGVGADGLIVIEPSNTADARMRMWNADGSEAGMCGNGIRCVAKYVYDREIARKDRLRIETGRGVLELHLLLDGQQVRQVRVGMGSPILKAAEIPTCLPGEPPLRAMLTLAGLVEPVEVTCVSMGNPHCVVFVDEPTDHWCLEIGPQIERHPAFPQRTNVEFVQVVSPNELRLRVWERGTGETRACGTGACAAVVAGVLTGRTGHDVLCRLPGGDLHVQWSDSGEVFLTGPAEEVFTGEWPIISP